MVVTTEFVHEANMQRDALGMPDLAPVVIDHPLSTLSDAEITDIIAFIKTLDDGDKRKGGY